MANIGQPKRTIVVVPEEAPIHVPDEPAPLTEPTPPIPEREPVKEPVPA